LWGGRGPAINKDAHHACSSCHHCDDVEDTSEERAASQVESGKGLQSLRHGGLFCHAVRLSA